jgi:hypothetical protein
MAIVLVLSFVVILLFGYWKLESYFAWAWLQHPLWKNFTWPLILITLSIVAFLTIPAVIYDRCLLFAARVLRKPQDSNEIDDVVDQDEVLDQ